MLSMSGKQLRIQHIFPSYDNSLPFDQNGFFSGPWASDVTVIDEEEFVPEYKNVLYSIDVDDSSIRVRFNSELGWDNHVFNGFGLHDFNDEISDFEVNHFRVVNGNVPDGMGVSDVSPLEGSDVFLWNFTQDKSADSHFSGGAEFIIDFKDPVLFNFDTKPGDDEISSLNTKSRGVTPMALYGGEDFEAGLVDPASILVSSDYDELIGGSGAQVNIKKNGKYHYSLEDINDDGFDDFVFKVKTQDLVNYVLPGEVNQIFVSGALDGNAFAATGAYLDIIGLG